MNDKLDNLLQKWAAGKAAHPTHLQDLAARISKQAATMPERAEWTQPEGLRIPFRTKLGYAALGAAAAMAVACFFLQPMRWAQGPSGGQGMDLAGVGISDKDAETSRYLFDEMERMFSERLRWIAQSNGDMGLGVDALQGEVAADAAPVIVRLTVVSRAIGGDVWAPVWTTDVLLRGEEYVEVVPNREEDNMLMLWVYPLADGKVAVDTNLALDRPVRVASRTHTVMQEGMPREMVTVQTEDREYRVFQSVKVLHGAAEENVQG